MSRKNKELDAIDKYIGGKIQELRIAGGLSRQQLADKIDVTHQQLQKYEKGNNRVTVGRLCLIAKALNKRVSYFIKDTTMETNESYETSRLMIEISRNMSFIKCPKKRKIIVDLTRAMID